MNRIFTTLLLCFLFSSLLVTAQQDIKQSEAKEIKTETWVHFQDHNNVSFIGQLAVCNDREILKLKVINRNPAPYEIRVSYVNGFKHLAPSLLMLQPMQEIEISCARGITDPIYLTDGHLVRIESLVIKKR